MGIDPRNLRPLELARLLNSTPLGPVANERQLHRHRVRAGFAVGGAHAQGVDLFRYVGWLCHTRHSIHAPAGAAATDGGHIDQGAAYERMKQSARQRNQSASEAGRDIGELPAVGDPARRARALGDFRIFCETYFAETFCFAWSPDHLKVIAYLERVVKEGGLFALAMPRGGGKSSLCRIACLWAALRGKSAAGVTHLFVLLVAANEGQAQKSLAAIKLALETNDRLLEDFPEVCYPIRKLERITNRCRGQTCQGQPTHIKWLDAEIALPWIAISQARGATIRAAGLTGGNIRGAFHGRPDGTIARPSLVVLDDPQDRESARSPLQCQTREEIVAGDVLGVAGPTQKIAAVMPCTVIVRGDLADTMLDREKHPDWQGERMKMVYAWPTNQKLWDQYAEIRKESLRRFGDIRDATAFYKKHRKAMDDGAVVAWPQRHNHDELSALQHAVNLKLRDPAAFAAEGQNEPLVETGPQSEILTVDEICAKVNGLERGRVPLSAQHLTCFIDVQKRCLYWLTCAWDANFSGAVIDYGTFPEQDLEYFSYAEIRHTLEAAFPGTGMEAWLTAGLTALTERLLDRDFAREDGAALRIERCLIDANWGESTDAVKTFCRRSKHAGVLVPSHGRGVGAASCPMDQYPQRAGEKVGHNWRVPPLQGQRTTRHVVWDTNFFKSFTHSRLAVKLGDPGCLSLFQAAPRQHRLLAEHLTSEFGVEVTGRGRKVTEWKLRPNRDNHWLDCLVGNCPAASMQRVALAGHERPAAHAAAARTRVNLTRPDGGSFFVTDR